MAEGLTVWDDQGRILIDAGTLFGRILGSFNTGVVNGSVSNPKLLEGTPFYYATIGYNTGFLCVVPQIVISGSNISWTFTDYTDGSKWGIERSASTVIYGIT